MRTIINLERIPQVGDWIRDALWSKDTFYQVAHIISCTQVLHCSATTCHRQEVTFTGYGCHYCIEKNWVYYDELTSCPHIRLSMGPNK